MWSGRSELTSFLQRKEMKTTSLPPITRTHTHTRARSRGRQHLSLFRHTSRNSVGYCGGFLTVARVSTITEMPRACKTQRERRTATESKNVFFQDLFSGGSRGGALVRSGPLLIFDKRHLF